jgi:Methyltransferase domain
MILRGNLPRLRDLCRDLPRVLDVGGWHNPFNLATDVLDIMPFETRRRHEALDPEDAERFSAATWHIRDICEGNWPWPDKSFDFAICSHTLEDIRDPIAVARELARVANAGYVEVPSRAREIFVKDRFSRLKMGLGRVPEIGFPHHRWFCDLRDGELLFARKGIDIALDRARYITREELGRKMTEAESGIGLFWRGSFLAREVIEISDADLAGKKRAIVASLRTGQLANAP